MAAAQTIPGRYIVEFNADPAVAVAIAARVRAVDVRPQMAARRTQILATHAPIEAAVRGLGGIVTRHFDTLLNGMVVQISDQTADRLRTLPGVRGVYPDTRMKPSLNYALGVHRIPDSWATLPGGPSGAGAGVKIGIIDSGIDVNHPGFQGFTTLVPDGYPIVSGDAEMANTNAKIIVSRDYTGTGGMDTDGHGTGNAMAAAGLTNNASLDYLLSDNVTTVNVPLSPITGAAPGAWLGNYKVCSNDGCATSDILQAMQDAVNDGMNVVSCSLGQPVADSSMEGGPESRVVRNAVAAGLVVVVSAGNDGQSPGTIEDPAVVPDTIAVGAIGNARVFDTAVTVNGQAPFEGALPDVSQDAITPDLYDPITGSVIDVTTLDGNGFGCNAFPADSLSGAIALIQRSPVGAADACAFDLKLANAMNAGALAAVIYNSVPSGLVFMTLQTASLPALFLSQADGQALQGLVAANAMTPVTLDFTGLSQFPASANFLATYSSTGPTPGGNIKPDMVAVGGGGGGGNACFAAGTCYGDLILTANALANNPDHPYNIVAGTSLATPIVAGGVAMVMGARPGLTGAQYKSLVVNSAPQFTEGISGTPGSPVLVGTGMLDVMAAMQNNLTVAPVSVNFGTAAGGANVSQSIVVTNIGAASDTFSVTVNSIDGGVPASVDVAQFTLAPGDSQTLNVSLAGAGLPAGSYDGYLLIQGTQTTVVTRVGYWFGVPGTATQTISVLNSNGLNASGFTPGEQATILVRLLDQSGIPLAADAPTVTALAARARVLKVAPYGDIPGTYSIQVALGRVSYTYDEFDVTSGGVTVPVYVPVY